MYLTEVQALALYSGAESKTVKKQRQIDTLDWKKYQISIYGTKGR